MATPLLEMRGITKRFGELVALDGVDLVVNEGEVHALVGENGAGKTTLMNILYGLYHSDAGTIRFRGQDAPITGPRDAIALGVGMIHQHFMLVPPLTVAENVVLGDERSGMAPVRSTRACASSRTASRSRSIRARASRTSRSASSSASRS